MLFTGSISVLLIVMTLMNVARAVLAFLINSDKKNAQPAFVPPYASQPGQPGMPPQGGYPQQGQMPPQQPQQGQMPPQGGYGQQGGNDFGNGGYQG